MDGPRAPSTGGSRRIRPMHARSGSLGTVLAPWRCAAGRRRPLFARRPGRRSCRLRSRRGAGRTPTAASSVPARPPSARYSAPLPRRCAWCAASSRRPRRTGRATAASTSPRRRASRSSARPVRRRCASRVRSPDAGVVVRGPCRRRHDRVRTGAAVGARGRRGRARAADRADRRHARRLRPGPAACTGAPSAPARTSTRCSLLRPLGPVRLLPWTSSTRGVRPAGVRWA